MTALFTPTSYTVDPWDPSYGVAAAEDGDGRESSAELDLDVERPAAEWAPITPAAPPEVPSAVLFLDGVRRIDARIWAYGADPNPTPGIAASLAAGLVCCDGTAQLVEAVVDRGLYTAAPEAPDLDTRHASYRARRTRPGLEALALGMQQRLSELEVELATSWRAGDSGGDDLLIVDGPLRGRTHLPRIVGYIKTHNKTYLPEEQVRVVTALAAGQRSPVFTMGTSWRRRSWYLRLPGAAASPWSAVVRLECSPDLSTVDTIALADLTAALLPGYASVAHKDPRAPQNLVPIGGLETQLRHRLGDPALLYRALRSATRSNGHAGTPSPRGIG